MPIGLSVLKKCVSGQRKKVTANYKPVHTTLRQVTTADDDNNDDDDKMMTRNVRITEYQFGFGFNCHIFDIHSDSFPTETARNPQFRLKVWDKNNLTCIHVQIKNILKHDQNRV